MTLWSKLLGDKVTGAKAQVRSGKAPDLTAPRPGVPSTVAVIPGKLTVTFHAHDSVEGATGNFLTAVTAGYRKYGQSEVVCTLRLPSDDDAIARMQELNRFFGTVHAWARQRQLTTAGGLTQFGERALFERGHSGILYADARPIPGVEIPPGAIAALLVDAAEVRAALDFGAYRVLMRIGERYRHFPFPLWSDLDRPSVVSERENETLLAKLPRIRAIGASFVVEDERVRIQLAPSERATLGRGVARLAEGAPFALLVKPAPSANAVLVWYPGQTEPMGITPDGSDGSSLSGSCLLIVPGGQRDQTRQVEDGYSLAFSTESWASVAAALLDERPLSLRMADGVTLSLEWLRDEPVRQNDQLA
jgi:hypothetical protein